MFARPRESSLDQDAGFTLIELLVVMIIIGILAAIAIPVFLNQRQKAIDASMKSDLRNVANEEFSYYVDANDYIALTGTPQNYLLNGSRISSSKGNTVAVTRLDLNGATVTSGPAVGFCVLISNPGGTHAWVYKSQEGGLQAPSVQTCP
jgi:prepilin-type N-terminal cleavage/methylation domain-containing protein